MHSIADQFSARYTQLTIGLLLGYWPGILFFFLFAPHANAEWVDWVVDANLDAGYHTNINQASIASEQEWDFAFRPTVNLGRVFQLAERTRVFAGALLGGDVFARFENLNAFNGAGEVSIFHKFGLADAPWLRVQANGGYRNVAAEQRSGPLFRVAAAAGKRFSPRFDARLEYTFTRRFGGSGPPVVPNEAIDVFNQRYHRITLDGNFLITEELLLSAGFTYQRGDFVSNAQASRFNILAVNDFEAVARDQVFGGWVYRLKGNGYEPFLRLNYGLGDHFSVGLGYRFRTVEGGGLNYRNHFVGATLYYRY